MRLSSLSYILVGILIFAASYLILNQPRFPNLSPDQFDVSGQSISDPPPIYKDESRLQDGDVAPAKLNTDEPTAKDEAPLNSNLPAKNQSSPTAKDEAQPDGKQSATNRSSDLKDAKQNFSYLAYYAYSEVPPETKPANTVLGSLEDTPRGTTVEEDSLGEFCAKLALIGSAVWNFGSLLLSCHRWWPCNLSDGNRFNI